jgi:hypothetical protein
MRDQQEEGGCYLDRQWRKTETFGSKQTLSLSLSSGTSRGLDGGGEADGKGNRWSSGTQPSVPACLLPLVVVGHDTEPSSRP